MHSINLVFSIFISDDYLYKVDESDHENNSKIRLKISENRGEVIFSVLRRLKIRSIVNPNSRYTNTISTYSKTRHYPDTKLAFTGHGFNPVSPAYFLPSFFKIYVLRSNTIPH